MTFTEAELAYLAEQRLGRIATASASGRCDVAPVTFAVDGDEIVVGGMDITKTVKYRNVVANPQASFVVDDLESVDPWRPRGVKLRGAATVDADPRGQARIRIRPETIWSWGINEGAETRFGPIERRDVP